MSITPNKTTKAALLIKQKWPLYKKVEHAKRRIIEFVESMGGSENVFISFSGGKDSTVLRHLVLSIYPNIECVFSNTTNEFPEILTFVRNTKNVTWLYPKKPYKQIVKEKGFPLVSKDVSTMIYRLRYPSEKNANSRNLYLTGYNQKGNYSKRYILPKMWYPLFDRSVTKFDITSTCCDTLKKNPVKIYMRKTKKKPFVGTMADDSQRRETVYIKYGCNIYTKDKEVSKPLSIWTEQDIWDYIKINNVPYSTIYDDKVLEDGTIIKGEKNTGCMFCGYGAHLEKESRFERIKQRNPRVYERCMNLENNGVKFKDALEFVCSQKIKRK